MKKTVILMIVVMFFMVPCVAADNYDQKAGKLFLFQKCDATLAGQTVNGVTYDGSGCPNPGQGPWPVLTDSNASGELDYSLWGDTFRFSFSGHGLAPATNYTLIYYPDPWPGDKGLICLSSGQSTPDKTKGKSKGKSSQKGGNLALHGDLDIGKSLPVSTDANFNPISPSGAAGAKIWLVLSDDVQCTGVPQMVKWNPASYLFEYNLIAFEYRPEE